MTKTTWTARVEWSDWSEYSPSRTGQLPCAIVLPDGERVEIDAASRFAAEENWAISLFPIDIYTVVAYNSR